MICPGINNAGRILTVDSLAIKLPMVLGMIIQKMIHLHSVFILKINDF